MRKDEKGVWILLFCAGLLLGLMLPGWMKVTPEQIMSPDAAGMREKIALIRAESLSVLRETSKNRMGTVLLLYLSMYTPAGSWVLAGASFLFGASIGVLAAFSVIRLHMTGLLLLLCMLLPHWPLYWMCGDRIASFWIRKKERARACALQGILPSDTDHIRSFLEILLLGAAGTMAECLVNPWLLDMMLRFGLRIFP